MTTFGATPSDTQRRQIENQINHNSQPNIVTLDLGSHTGWTVDANDVLESGTQIFDLKRGESAGMRFLHFSWWLANLLIGAKPEIVAYEMPHHRGGPATELLVGMQTRVMEVCASKQINYQGVHTATLKKHATGSGRASKQEMIQAARRAYPGQAIENDHEADALLILDWVRNTITGT